MKKRIYLKNLDCAHCAAELERELGKIEGVLDVSVDFVGQSVFLHSVGEETLKKVNSENVRAVADLQSTVLSRGTHPINVAIVVDGIENTAVSNPEDYIIYVEVS